MSKPKKPKKPKDTNQLAKLIADITIGDTERPENKPSSKNPAAVALGRLGGLKRGKARSEKLTKERRSEIAKKAASKRWNKE